MSDATAPTGSPVRRILIITVNLLIFWLALPAGVTWAGLALDAARDWPSLAPMPIG